MKFFKYHGLGNDYIVLDRSTFLHELTPKTIELICHRNFGVGSDGIVYLQEVLDDGFLVRIFNPDGSEAENSGNGMRIMSRYLFDQGLVKHEPFRLFAKGERQLLSQIIDPQNAIEVQMGKASFLSSEIPVIGPEREVLNEEIELLGETLTYCCVNVGNPHCVVLGREDLKNDVLNFGPHLEENVRFPKKINVQFAKILDRKNVQVEIWERGAGYTLASGSSSCAVASVAFKLGLIDDCVKIHLAGGELSIKLTPEFDITLSGSVVKVSQGEISPEMFDWKEG